MNLCSFCCCDHSVLPVFSLSHRPYHTPLNTSVEISWHCLVLDRSPSTVCLVQELYTANSSRFLGFSAFYALPWDFGHSLHTQIFRYKLVGLLWEGPRPSCKHFPGATGRSCLSVPTSPCCSSGWAFAVMPQGPLGSGRAKLHINDFRHVKEMQLWKHTGYISYETSKVGHACSSCLAGFNHLCSKPEQLPRTILLSLCQDHKGLFKEHSKTT